MSRYKKETVILSSDLTIEFNSNGIIVLHDEIANNKIFMGESEFEHLLIAGLKNRCNHNPESEG